MTDHKAIRDQCEAALAITNPYQTSVDRDLLSVDVMLTLIDEINKFEESMRMVQECKRNGFDANYCIGVANSALGTVLDD